MGFIGKNKVNSVEYDKSAIDRQILKIIVNANPTSKVLVIMKNPSSTCANLPNGNNTITSYSDRAKCHIDRTTGRVLRKLKTVYDEIDILNLYSLYDSKPSNVDTYYYSTGSLPPIFSSNNSTISNYLNAYSGNIICAWGLSNGIRQPEYDNQIAHITSLFNAQHHLLEYDPSTNNFINRTTTNYPPHGLTWK